MDESVTLTLPSKFNLPIVTVVVKYGTILWGNSSKSKKDIYILQKKTVRIMGD
jgi:hypothetical protein